MMVRFRLALFLSLVVLLLGASAASADTKNNYTYFAEAQFLITDAAGVSTFVGVYGVDYLNAPDEVSIGIDVYNSNCPDPNGGCPFVPFGGSARVAVAEGDLRIQPNLNWGRISTSLPFVDSFSGTTCTLTIDLILRAVIGFVDDGDDGVGFRRADPSGTVTCAGKVLNAGPGEVTGQLSRYIPST